MLKTQYNVSHLLSLCFLFLHQQTFLEPTNQPMGSPNWSHMQFVWESFNPFLILLTQPIPSFVLFSTKSCLYCVRFLLWLNSWSYLERMVCGPHFMPDTCWDSQRGECFMRPFPVFDENSCVRPPLHTHCYTHSYTLLVMLNVDNTFCIKISGH